MAHRSFDIRWAEISRQHFRFLSNHFSLNVYCEFSKLKICEYLVFSFVVRTHCPCTKFTFCLQLIRIIVIIFSQLLSYKVQIPVPNPCSLQTETRVCFCHHSHRLRRQTRLHWIKIKISFIHCNRWWRNQSKLSKLWLTAVHNREIRDHLWMPAVATATVETYDERHALSSPSSQRSGACDFDTNAKEDRLVRFLAQTVHPKIEHIPPFKLSDIVVEPSSSFPASQKISRIGEFTIDLPHQLHVLIRGRESFSGLIHTI